jgi:hypothetical protein
MLITHGISNRGILSADELAFLCQAFDAACLINGDPLADAETMAKAIIVTYEQGVTKQEGIGGGSDPLRIHASRRHVGSAARRR